MIDSNNRITIVNFIGRNVVDTIGNINVISNHISTSDNTCSVIIGNDSSVNIDNNVVVISNGNNVVNNSSYSVVTTNGYISANSSAHTTGNTSNGVTITNTTKSSVTGGTGSGCSSSFCCSFGSKMSDNYNSRSYIYTVIILIISYISPPVAIQGL